ncbi:MAG: methyl-accepting chemotaxis protein, partial [Leptospiraceae bacterium]|nr:methyl-accepting chemotaxis protein [Leptospiraceae bacterium]
QGIIRSKLTGTDPFDGSTFTDWKDRLSSIFTSQLLTLDVLNQLRYLDTEGNEMVRVNKSHGKIYVVPEAQLQNKSKRYYFEEILKLKKDELYISPVDLNMENDEIQKPYAPTIRIGTKVFSDDDGTFQGIILLNFDAKKIFSLLKESVLGETFILNKDGYFISHKNEEKTFGFQLGTEENYFYVHPEFKENIKDKESLVYFDNEENSFRVWKKFFFQENDRSRFWVVVHNFDEDLILRPFMAWNKLFITLTFMVIVLVTLLAWFLAESMVKPIIKIENAASGFEEGSLQFNIDEDLKQRDDEIGHLAKALDSMGKNMLEGNIMLDQAVKEKTKELEKRMKELEEFNSVMIGREKRMIELKQKINELSLKLGEAPPFDIPGA